MSVEVRNITKSFGSFVALRDVSLKIPSGKLVALLGPSGSGKTTLLRIIAGLDFADPGSGSVLFYDDDVSRHNVGERKVGFVFQHYSLFRHMNIFENVAFGLRVRPRKSRPSNEEIESRVSELLKLVQLERVAKLYPSQLSGGQRQRVALIRALAVEPKILLLDEPFGALDAAVRKELRQWLRRLHDKMPITSILVTHDQEEALEVADRIVVLNDGRIEQEGSPEEVYDKPATPFVYDFLGSVNIFHCRVDNDKLLIGEKELHTAGRPSVVAYVRPHDVHISKTPGAGTMPARIAHINIAGPIAKIQLVRVDTDETVEAEITRQHYGQLQLTTGETVFINLHNPRIFEQDYVI